MTQGSKIVNQFPGLKPLAHTYFSIYSLLHCTNHPRATAVSWTQGALNGGRLGDGSKTSSHHSCAEGLSPERWKCDLYPDACGTRGTRRCSTRTEPLSPFLSFSPSSFTALIYNPPPSFSLNQSSNVRRPHPYRRPIMDPTGYGLENKWPKE